MTNVTMLASNRPRLTQQALQSLNLEPSDKALVLHDGNDKDTQAVLYAWSEENYRKDRTVYAVDGSRGTGWARNEVIRMSQSCFGSGDYLYLSDNDVFFYPAWLEKLTGVYEAVWKQGFKVLGAYNHPFHQAITTLPIQVGGHKVCEVKEVIALSLQSMLMKWEVWDKYGPFCETPVGRVCMGEDIDFTNKIRADGGRLGVISPALVVNTGITNSFGEKIPGWEMVQAECPKGILCE
jgi:GT2 family glycosyltransferase